jgi:hypothetical protein
MEGEMSDKEKPKIDPRFMPMIEKAEYPAFQRLIAGLPGTYELWMDAHNAEKNAWEKRWDFQQDAQVVDVSIAEFRKHLAYTGKPANVHTLWLCAREKAARGPST